MSFPLTLIGLVALLGVAAGCDSRREAETTSGATEGIVIVPFRELGGLECEEALQPSQTPFAYPATATVREIEEEPGRFLVPESIPAGMELKSRSLGDRASYMVFESAEEQGQPQRVVTIAQGPTHGEVLKLPVKEGYYERVTVRGSPAYVIRGSLVIISRSVDGVETVESCEWNPDGVISVGFVSDGHSVIVVGSPGGEFPPDELLGIAASLVGSTETKEGALR